MIQCPCISRVYGLDTAPSLLVKALSGSFVVRKTIAVVDKLETSQMDLLS
jgi:predicted nucleotidyltransferase